jgi:hypothetical protein
MQCSTRVNVEMFRFRRNLGYISYISNISVLLTFLSSDLKLSSDYLFSLLIYLHARKCSYRPELYPANYKYNSVMNMLCEILKLSRLFKVIIEQTIKVRNVVLKLNSIVRVFFKIIYLMYISNI